MKICLINPPCQGIIGIYPSLGLGYIAAVLLENGFNPDYLDINVSKNPERDLKSHLSINKPQLIGLSCTSFNFTEAKKIGRIARQVVRNIIIVVGGPHVSIYPSETLKNPEFDIAVYGEGEYAFLEISLAINRKNDFSKISGIAYKKNGQIIINPPRLPINNLDDIPFPARHIMPTHKYYHPVSREHLFTNLITSRGCPFKCIFCKPIHGTTLRLRSAKNVLDEIEHCATNLKIKEFDFMDDSFTLNKKRIFEICDGLIKRKLNIIWNCRTRVDLVDKDILKSMKAAGCYRICYGVESGDQRILDSTKKGINLNQVKSVFNWTREVRIESYAFFMIGIPGENLETIRKTIDFSKNLNTDHVQFSITTASPGTEMYLNYLRERGGNYDIWREYALGNTTARPNIIFPTKKCNEEDLNKIAKGAYKEFYFRLNHILQSIGRIRSFKDFYYWLRWVKFIICNRL